MLPHEKVVADEIATTHAANLKAMTELHDLVVEILTVGEWEVPRRGLSALVVVTVAGLMMKAAKTFRAIQILAEKGLVDDAKALIRVLYETSVAVLFILQKHSRQRARQYHAHDASNTLKMIDHWKRTLGLTRKATKKALADASHLLAVWSKGLPQTVDFKRHWSGLGSFEAAAKAIGHEKMYATLYRYTSTSTHATDFGAHVDAVSDKEQLLFDITPSLRSVGGISGSAREVLWIVMSRVDQRFRLGYATRLNPHKVTAIP